MGCAAIDVTIAPPAADSTCDVIWSSTSSVRGSSRSPGEGGSRAASNRSAGSRRWLSAIDTVALEFAISAACASSVARSVARRCSSK